MASSIQDSSGLNNEHGGLEIAAEAAGRKDFRAAL